jgi:hypothetical protein
VNRVVIILVLLVIFLTGCTRPTELVEGHIIAVKANSFVVDCSDEVNEGKKGAINTIGYGCPVDYTNQTTFRDESGKSLSASDFSVGTTVKVILVKPVDIKASVEKKKPYVLSAKQIVLLTRKDSIP